MLHAFSINRVKLMTRTPKTTNKLRQKEYWSCAKIFAATHHYRKRLSCRVSGALPSVLFRALGKDAFAECFFWHSAKRLFAKCFFNTRQRVSLPSVFLTLGKELLCRVFFFDTRQRASLPSVIFFTLGKKNFKAHFEAVN